MDTLVEVAALEVGGGAGDGRAALLVGVVETVVVAVADPGLRYTVAGALARKLEVGTRLLSTGVS